MAKAETVPVATALRMVIFGAGGDLTKRLVTPALYNLVTAKRLPDGFRLRRRRPRQQDRGRLAQDPRPT